MTNTEDYRRHYEEVSGYLGAPQQLGIDWVGQFSIATSSDTVKCKVYASTLIFDEDNLENEAVLHLVNHKAVDVPSGRCYILDYFTTGFTVRIGRIPEGVDGGPCYTVYLIENGEEIGRQDVEIEFTPESLE